MSSCGRWISSRAPRDPDRATPRHGAAAEGRLSFGSCHGDRQLAGGITGGFVRLLALFPPGGIRSFRNLSNCTRIKGRFPRRVIGYAVRAYHRLLRAVAKCFCRGRPWCFPRCGLDKLRPVFPSKRTSAGNTNSSNRSRKAWACASVCRNALLKCGAGPKCQDPVPPREAEEFPAAERG